MNDQEKSYPKMEKPYLIPIGLVATLALCLTSYFALTGVVTFQTEEPTPTPKPTSTPDLSCGVPTQIATRIGPGNVNYISLKDTGCVLTYVAMDNSIKPSSERLFIDSNGLVITIDDNTASNDGQVPIHRCYEYGTSSPTDCGSHKTATVSD